MRVEGDDIVLVVLNFGDEPADSSSLLIDPGAVVPGTYQPETLLGGVAAPPLTVNADGTIELSPERFSIPANATWVFALHPTP